MLITALFGIPRRCPKDPLAESFWDVKKCDADKDCDFPRICCPNGRKRYCMNSYTEPEELPVGRQIAYPVESLSQYFQCTPPPPQAFDKHPKPCNSSLTCFPNICCLEGGRKHCRPPKRNILAALTTFSQRFNVGWIRDFTENLVIRRWDFIKRLTFVLLENPLGTCFYSFSFLHLGQHDGIYAAAGCSRWICLIQLKYERKVRICARIRDVEILPFWIQCPLSTRGSTVCKGWVHICGWYRGCYCMHG